MAAPKERPPKIILSAKELKEYKADPPPRRRLARALNYPEYVISNVIAGRRVFPELEKVLGIWKPGSKGA